ncbi:MAG: HAD family hydrolase [Ruminococcaceae bacterium]|nr:HAD family hydrolase [Oscillospiraceae bacterium]
MFLQNFIWDFDGMLFDSYGHITEAFMQAYKRIHQKDIDRQECYDLFKKSFRTAYDFYQPSALCKLLFRAIESKTDLAPAVLPYPGIPEILKKIHENGGRNFLNTHRDSLALTYLAQHDLLIYFTDAITSEINTMPSKPAPDTNLYLIKKYNLNPETTVMIGDRDVDIDSGTSAGIKTCLFDEFKTSDHIACDYRVYSTIELSKALGVE